MNEVVAPSRREVLLYETGDGIGRLGVGVDVNCRLLPDGPSPVARKRGSNDAA